MLLVIVLNAIINRQVRILYLVVVMGTGGLFGSACRVGFLTEELWLTELLLQ